MAVDLESAVMAENLMIQTHRSSTPAFREGWDRTFNQFPFRECGYKITLEKGRIQNVEKINAKNPFLTEATK